MRPYRVQAVSLRAGASSTAAQIIPSKRQKRFGLLSLSAETNDKSPKSLLAALAALMTFGGGHRGILSLLKRETPASRGT